MINSFEKLLKSILHYIYIGVVFCEQILESKNARKRQLAHVLSRIGLTLVNVLAFVLRFFSHF